MVLPARRFRSNDMVLSKDKMTSDHKSSADNHVDCESNPQNRLFNAIDFTFYNTLKFLCDGCLFGAVYLINGIKLEGFFCGFDDEVVLLSSPDSDVKQMIYHHAIATLQVEERE